MTTGKDIASFFENGSTDQFEYCFKLYPQVLKLKAEKRNKKPQDLIRLDEWYQNELPKLIKARGKDAHMVYDELVQTMKWKQARGKFYPQLSYLVKVNTPRAVMQETKKAFRKLPNLEQAITALSNLKGVGTTMASALLAAASPDSAPFMADECLMAIPEIEGIDYTTKEYLNFVQHIQATVERLNKQAGGGAGGGGVGGGGGGVVADGVVETPPPFWSPHRVELALWAHYVANDLNPELLEEMPGPGAAGANTNGSAAKAKLALVDDTTNDADDESLGAAGRGGETNNTATESETENENTNPPPMATAAGVLQDGDSNFLSNDSVSQEPIMDENTTQTTATTSTDEGEVGTPLASDSESNLEAPMKVNAAAPNTAVGSAVVEVAPPAAVANTKSCSDNKATIAPTGNGNGALLVPGGIGGTDSLDGENSSCLRSLANEEASGEEDEDDEEEDESSNSNSRSRGHKSVTPIISNLNEEGTNNTITNTNTDNDSTLSSAGIALGQKRGVLHCIGGGGGGDGVGVEDTNSQPDAKKARSD